MEGTVVRPDGDGPFPAVVLVAGSGPTDRDWCSPLLPGSNGSGRLFAEAFAAAGIASLRFDKRASGPHAIENVTRLIGTMSMQSHLNELIAAVRCFRVDFVDSSRIVGFGNSEGAIHVLHYAVSAQAVPSRGSCSRRRPVARYRLYCCPSWLFRPLGFPVGPRSCRRSRRPQPVTPPGSR